MGGQRFQVTRLKLESPAEIDRSPEWLVAFCRDQVWSWNDLAGPYRINAALECASALVCKGRADEHRLSEIPIVAGNGR